MKIANLSVDRPVLISMIMLVLILLGVVALPLLPVDLYPSLDIPMATVSVSWNGATPGVIEQLVTKPLEASMSSVSDVTEVDSMSRNGRSMVMVHFNYGKNMDEAVADMRDKVNQVVGKLPSGTGTPMVSKIDPNSSPIMSLALSGNNVDVEQLKQLVDDVVAPRLQQVDGVSAVNVNGGKTREIQVIVDPDRLNHYGLAISAVTSALQADNQQADAGLVQKGTREVTLHLGGQFNTPGDVLNVPIKLSSGSVIKVSDIAQVKDTYADVTQEAIMNGAPCVSLDIMKVSGGNTVQTSSGVQAIIPSINSQLPQGVTLSLITDQAKYIQQSINTVVSHTLFGGAFALIILWLFLRKVRTTAVIGIVIPISIISTFAAMHFAHQTINTITLGGLALGMGSLVDFAVVVIESIFRYKEDGYGAIDAAKKGTAEVGTAVMASALSQISVFVPIVFVQGYASQIFLPMALAVVFSHIAALIGALTLVPMLASKLMQGKFNDPSLESGNRFDPSLQFNHGINFIRTKYGQLLSWSLIHKKIILSFTAILVIICLVILPVLGFDLMPNLDQGQYSVRISMDQGTKLDTTKQVVLQVQDMIKQMPETDSIFTVAGSSSGSYSTSGTDSGSITVILKPLAERKASVFQVIEELRQKVANIPGAQISIQATQLNIGSAGSGMPIQIVLEGNDINVLRELGDLVAAQVQQVQGTRSVSNTMDKSSDEYDLNIDRTKTAQYGITTQQILNTLSTAYSGTTATSYNAGATSVDVDVMFPESFTNDYNHINDMMITTSSGNLVPLSAVATIKPNASPTTIRRQNQIRQATIQSDVTGRSVSQVQDDIQAKLSQITFPPGYSWQFGGQAIDMNSSFKALGLAMPLSILFMYMVMAGQFESLLSPFIIMFALPGTFVGVVLGLLVMRDTISINALMGVIMLIGIVVNNAIVLVDYTNQLVKNKGMAIRDALVRAGEVRFRPILMTTFTTVLAMFPLLLGHGEGAEAQAPMAAVVVFGLICSTLITLVLVPVMYAIINERKHGLRHWFLFKKDTDIQEAAQQG